jgi:hypothetical protein
MVFELPSGSLHDDDDDDDDINLRPAGASETCCPDDLPKGIGTC